MISFIYYILTSLKNKWYNVSIICHFVRFGGIFMNHNTIVNDEHYSGLNPVLFGYEDCECNYFFGPAIRKYYLLHFVVSGFGTFETARKTYSVGPGEIFFIRPDEETYYKADAIRPWTYIWIGFTADSPLPIVLDDITRCPEAAPIFDSMKQCEQMLGGQSAFLAGKLWEFFSKLLENEAKTKGYIDRALDCIHNEYMNDISVEQIAQRLNLSRTYFSTIFKDKMLISPKQYLINYRMSIAASLLVKDEKNVSITASSVGYNDIFTFSKMFKRHFGVSPQEYVLRKSIEKNTI